MVFTAPAHTAASESQTLYRSSTCRLASRHFFFLSFFCSSRRWPASKLCKRILTCFLVRGSSSKNFLYLNGSYTRLLSHQQSLAAAFRPDFGQDSPAFHHESRLRVEHQVRFDGHGSSITAFSCLQPRPRDQGHSWLIITLRVGPWEGM